ncbi:MinD/ParA family ATP-binding protein, partial [Mycolicibacterium pulveris]
MTDRDDALRRDLGWTGSEAGDVEPSAAEPQPTPPPPAEVPPARFGPPPGMPRDTGPIPGGARPDPG